MHYKNDNVADQYRTIEMRETDMTQKKTICEKIFDEERALYHLTDSCVENCVFAGPRDGESALKEARNIEVRGCSFSLRYPFWHTKGFVLAESKMDELTRAPIWYAEDGVIDSCEINGIKCLRECKAMVIRDSVVKSPEFGWRCSDISIENCRMESEYFLFECRNVSADGLKMKGKYSFQYVENLDIRHSYLDTKDAFWHAKNVTVYDSVLKGEYLGWYSENLTLVRCRIEGTQPLCYCKNLKLIDCTTEGCDLSFEYSDVEAEIIGSIDSVKNPHTGYITADSIGEIVLEDSVMENTCVISERGKQLADRT